MFSGFAVVFLVFFGAICVIAVVVVGSVARIRIGGGPHYRRQLRDWATARDWTYHEDDGGEWTSLLPKGDGLGGWGVKLQLDGTRQGRQVTVAHYWYRKTETARDGGTSLHTANVPVIVVRLATRYPAVALQIRRPSRLFPVVFPVVPWAAGLPASVTGVAEFDRRYRIIHTATPGGSALVTPQVISAYLASSGPREGLKARLADGLPPWQLSGDLLIVAPLWEWIRVGRLDQMIDNALTVASLLDSPSAQP
jgi:hypothetical protein